MLSQISATTLQNISDRSVVTVCFLWFYQYSVCASLFFCCWGFFFHVVASFTFLLHIFSFCHTSMPTYTDQTMLKVTKHLFYLYPPFSTLSLPHPPVPPIAPVPAVHPCVIDRGVHISLLPPFSTPVSPEPPPSLSLTCHHQMAHHLPPTVNKSCNYPSCPTKGNSHSQKNLEPRT